MSGIAAGPAGLFITVAAAALALGFALLIRRAFRSTRFHTAATILVPAAPAAVAAFAAGAGWPESAWVPPLVLAAVSAFALFARVPTVRRVVATAGARTDVRVGLAAAGLLACVWWALRDRPPTPAPANATEKIESRPSSGVAAIRALSSPVAHTDRGRRIPLYEIPESDMPPEVRAGIEVGMIKEWGPSLSLIRTEPADIRSDCHGWVFANGEVWILGGDVGAILEDNRYQQVDTPAAGDLVLYRNPSNEIAHSGVVFASLPGGRVLVESKWVWLGVYLHKVNDHPHGGQASFYRSDREGHRLVFTTPSGAPVAPGSLRGAQ